MYSVTIYGNGYQEVFNFDNLDEAREFASFSLRACKKIDVEIRDNKTGVEVK